MGLKPFALAALLAAFACCKSPGGLPTPIPVSQLAGDAGDGCHVACALLRKNNCDGIGDGCELNCENDQLQGSASQNSPADIVAAGTLQALGAAAGTTCTG